MSNALKYAFRSRYRRVTGSTLLIAGLGASLFTGIVAPHLAPSGLGPANWFLAQLFFSVLFVGGAGIASNGHFLGAALDQRNRLSLSRLQMLMWTLLVLSALVVLAAWQISHGLAYQALNIVIPPMLLSAMGIATTSFVAAPVLLSLKPEESAQSVAVNANAGKASLLDLVQGDEAGNRDTIDLSKLQQLAITLLLIGVYAAMLYAMFRDLPWPLDSKPASIKAFLKNNPRLELPPLSETLVFLMGISHTGYLLYKAAPKPETRPDAVSTPSGPTSDIGALND